MNFIAFLMIYFSGKILIRRNKNRNIVWSSSKKQAWKVHIEEIIRFATNFRWTHMMNSLRQSDNAADLIVEEIDDHGNGNGDHGNGNGDHENKNGAEGIGKLHATLCK